MQGADEPVLLDLKEANLTKARQLLLLPGVQGLGSGFRGLEDSGFLVVE